MRYHKVLENLGNGGSRGVAVGFRELPRDNDGNRGRIGAAKS